MTAGLWIAASGLPLAGLADAVPPACRRSVEALALSTAHADGEDVLVETSAWQVDGATHFVPAFCALTDVPYSARVELSARVGGGWAPWTAGVGLGPAEFPPLPSTDALAVDVDEFRAPAPVEAVRARVRIRAPARATVLAARCMLTLSADAGATPAPPAGGAGVKLDVPALSQMETDPEIARRICSPTCVAMVLHYWKRPTPPAALAAEMFHPGVDLYGVWPAAIVAAGRRGLAGYLLRFPDWSAAAWCLERGMPLIASVRYADGELSGAAVAATSGHLVVLTGADGDEALVNDPGAPDAAGVSRRYRIAELARVWLERTGVGYVLFPPAR